jgi:hypothetical protein
MIPTPHIHHRPRTYAQGVTNLITPGKKLAKTAISGEGLSLCQAEKKPTAGKIRRHCPASGARHRRGVTGEKRLKAGTLRAGPGPRET